MDAKKFVLCNPIVSPDPFNAADYRADVPPQVLNDFAHSPAAIAIITKAWVKLQNYEAWIRDITQSGGALCVEMCHVPTFEERVEEAKRAIGDAVTAERLALLVHAFQARVTHVAEMLLGGRFAMYVGNVEQFGAWFADLVISNPDVWGYDTYVKVGGECVGVEVDDTVYTLKRTGFTPEVVPAYCPW